MNTTKLLRHVNAQNCLAILRDKGALSRADLARELGTTRTTIGNAIRELVEAGLVSTAPQSTGVAQLGRPGTAVRLAPNGAFFIGVELATRHISAVLLDFSMAVRERIHISEAPIEADTGAIIARVSEVIAQLMKKARISQRRVHGLGITVPSIVSPAGHVRLPPVEQRFSVDIGALLAPDLPSHWVIRCCNNAAAVAISLCETLSTDEKDDFLFIYLTDGVGSARVRGGRVDRGFRGVAGEIGYLFTGPRLSKTADRYQQLTGYERFSKFLNPHKDPAEALRDLAEAVPSPDDFEPALEDWADCLAAGFLNVIYLTDPARIVLGGPLAVLYPRVAAKVRAALEANFLPGVDLPPIEAAHLDAEVVAIGAAALIRQDLFRLPELAPARAAV